MTGRGRLKTCSVCRQSLHHWEKRRPAEILERSQKLTKYRNRMATFAIVKDDDVQLVDHRTLTKKGIMEFRTVKRKAAVIQLHLRKRKRA